MISTVAIRAAALSVAATFVPLAMGAPAAMQAATTTVDVQDVADLALGGVFSPGSITISAGDTVQWNWTGTSQHSVTADDSSFDSAIRTGPAASYSRQFNTPGSFAYFCQIHGASGGNGMSGTVVVQAAPATSTFTSTPTPVAATVTAAPTDTPGSTTTPGSVTPTRTPTVATGTPAAPATPTLNAPTVAVALPTAPATRSSAEAAQLPRTGTGGGAPGSTPCPGLMLAVGSLVAMLGAITVGKRS